MYNVTNPKTDKRLCHIMISALLKPDSRLEMLYIKYNDPQKYKCF